MRNSKAVPAGLQRLDEYMATGGAPEQAAAHMNCQAAEFRAVVSPLSNPDKKILAMHARIVKHFGGDGTNQMVHWVCTPLRLLGACMLQLVQ